MLNAEVEIVSLYENDGLSIEEISHVSGFEPLSIKALLASKSGIYRERAKAAAPTPSEDTKLPSISETVSESEFHEFMDAYKQLARYAETDGVRERALRNIINVYAKVNDGLGEQGIVKALKDCGNTKVNILVLNQQLSQARRKKQMIASSPMFGENPTHAIDAILADEPKVNVG